MMVTLVMGFSSALLSSAPIMKVPAGMRTKSIFAPLPSSSVRLLDGNLVAVCAWAADEDAATNAPQIKAANKKCGSFMFCG